MPNNQIIIKKDYFDNIKTAIDSINSFFSSNYKEKNFPVVDIDFQLDSVIMTILSWFNTIEPTWINDPDKVNSVVDSIHEATESMDGDIYTQLTNNNNTLVLDHINAFIGFKMLQFIGDNFTDFSKLINGIYTFELFTQPSKFKDVIDTFSQDIPLTEIEDIMSDNTYTIFDEKKYITGIFNNEQITLPESMKLESEINRFSNCNDLSNIEIVIDESVQEATEINFFKDIKPSHIKYDEKTGKFKISKQFEKTVDDMIDQLKQINSISTLMEWFTDCPEGYPDKFTSVVVPYILSRVFDNPKKFPGETVNIEDLKKYTNSYNSILNKNNGAKRFKNFDIFSTYKADKDGTLKFLEDFLKLNLVNDEEAYISNNSLLVIFNIFDSRIYLDIMYNMIPDKVKRKDNLDEDSFVKKIRARINRNSRNANLYKSNSKVVEGNETPTSEKVQEYVYNSLKEMGDMSIEDMQFCEQFCSVINDEISILGDIMYNRGISQIAIDHYIGESYDIFQVSCVQEQEMGDIPDYMKNRINISDGSGKGPNVTMTDVNLPPDVPMNSINDLASSIDTRLQGNGDLEDMLGSGSKSNGKNIVYNITNNYHNSFNRDSNNTTNTSHNDSSTGKSTTINNTNSYNDNSSSNKPGKHRSLTNTKGLNNYNNSDDFIDTKDLINTNNDSNQKFSSGNTVQEVFAFLESEEPLSYKSDAKVPKNDLLTTAMDIDRKTLSSQQTAKKNIQKVVNTSRAVLKPVARTKQWLTKMVDSLIKRDEDKVKAEIIENPSYRTALYKTMRLAIKCGLTGLAFTVSGYLGATYVVIQGAKVADKQRLKKEVQEEFATELEILNDKIARASSENTPESRKAMWQMMRLRSKMERIALSSPRAKLKHPTTVV